MSAQPLLNGSPVDALALQAVIYTLPLYEMARMRASTCPRRLESGEFAATDPASTLRWLNGFRHTRVLLTPRNREVVSPNNDTLYDNAWLDLSEGPLIIDLPAMGDRYWTLGFLDMWTNPFAYAGRRTTGGQAQRLFIHGPGWTGAIPSGVIEIAAPGWDVWIIGRMLAVAGAGGDADLSVAHALQAGYAIRRAGEATSLAWSRFDTAMTDDTQDVPPVALFQRTVRECLRRNPAAITERSRVDLGAILDRFSLRDHAPSPEDSDLQALGRALEQAYASLRENTRGFEAGHGWSVPVLVRTNYGDDFATRARVARNLIGALGVEEAMYPVCEQDEAGRPLDGRRRYELRFPPGGAPKVGAFWSLTAYRRQDCLLIDNPIDRYSIGDRTAGLVWDADGSLRIRLQSDDPGPEHNWLPTADDDDFYLTLRLYQPSEEHLDLRFVYPPVMRLD